MGQLPGITREEEEKRLKQTIDVAQRKLDNTKADVKALAEELHAMLEDFDESDKGDQALWNNTDARFKEVNHDLHRAEQARKKPYFGRIDFRESGKKEDESFYIGRSVIAKDPAHPMVIDWRAPIASVYYDSSLGKATYSVKGEGRFEVELFRKRTYEIERDKLKDFYDSDVVANDELLTKYLAKNKKAVLGEIIATIQQEQNEAIRKKPQHNMIVQGAAGSGKTTVAMHRISYILYNYELEFAPEDFYIIGSNQVLLNYITGVLPELNVYGVSQMTMEQLFVRLLYEDWDKKYKIKPVTHGVTSPVKGTSTWFHKLEDFCKRYEWQSIPREDVVLKKTGVVLLTKATIEKLLEEFDYLSRADKITKLTEHVIAKLENEISGKYYSYTPGEKKQLLKQYEVYFGKREWKGSIFDLYERFLLEQQSKGTTVEIPNEEFDVYDLAALAYLYKRIKETDIIREAGHVVIDEAQDFGMMAYHSLKYCLSKCTYTIMGDVSQNISLEYGLNDWSELRELMLPGEFDYFGLLQKSYRNTVEIADFATNILQHGSFLVYPIQPIIRHGSEVEICAKGSFDGLISETVSTIRTWRTKGYETIAVVCKDEEETAKVSSALRGKIELGATDPALMEFQNGVMVMPLAYTKGLEFDAVLIFDASAENYPSDDGYVKRLYVAATRALHELKVLHKGPLTGLIADPVPEERLKRAVVPVSQKNPTVNEEEEEPTNVQLYERWAAEGEQEMLERNSIGPRRIVAAKPAVTSSNVSESSRGRMRVKLSSNAATIPSYLERRQQELAREKPARASGEYGEMPDNQKLTPPGHGRIDCSVRMCIKGKGYYDIISNYGTLRIMPVAGSVFRICFAKGQGGNFSSPMKGLIEKGFSIRSRETKDAVEMLTDKMGVTVDKKTGIVTVRNSSGKPLLKERQKDPRQLAEGSCYQFFEWEKKEHLIARGITDESHMPMGASAKYISFGPDSDRMPGVASDKGYEILFPTGSRILCCNIAMYGPYMAMENTDFIDYYVRVK